MKITDFCTGCRACEQKCPTRSIKMIADEEGFLNAVIDASTCIHCMLCIKTCPQNTPIAKHQPKLVLAVRDKDDKELRESASGGAFMGMAKLIVEKEGVVYGAAYNDSLVVEHCVAHNYEELKKLQSSKYVQSDTTNTFANVKASLKTHKTIVYSGTPCQIAGLKAFLGKDYDSLYTIEIICHGVASPLLFQKYISWIEERIHSKVRLYNFRSKDKGWGYRMCAIGDKETVSRSSDRDSYYYHFIKGDVYRECCYQCLYCTRQRVADLTIGDYWGIEKEHPHFHSREGVSVVLVNTEKGEQLWSHSSEEFCFTESLFEKAERHNHNLTKPTERKAIRDYIYQGIRTKAVSLFFSENMRIPFSLKAAIKGILPSYIKHLIKRFL